ncbi:ABC transporter permease subunit [Bacillus pacificus]|uniref:ABC transporter permease n=1 Tax=Bacillus cereus group TaxID=86661 RepID=UPI000BFB9C51|nr:ABC transporter permease subunit [Bacillus cereus]PGZ54419.1 peptide ABC transporter permease [Bacillus anthracis]
MWNILKKDKYFLISISFLILVFLISIGFSLYTNDNIPQVSIKYDEKGNVQAAPFPPSSTFLLGTDTRGYDLLHRVILGAKWSIGITFLIAILRTILSIGIGFYIAFYVKRKFRTLEGIFDSFTVIPMTLIAYFILNTVLRFENGDVPPPFYQRAIFESITLVILALPTLAFYFANETKKLLSEEFMHAAEILGGSKWHKIKKHILPNIFPICMIVLIQQFVQALILLSHLGILELFFGGTILTGGGKEADSVSNEWSGLIGLYFRSLSTQPWIPLAPIACFIITIIVANLLVRRVTIANENRYTKNNIKENSDNIPKQKLEKTSANSFTFYNKGQ